MKKGCLVFFAVLIIVISLPVYARTDYAAPAAPSIQAHSAALIDVATNQILFSSHGDEPMRIASLTKIMTAIIAIEQGTLSDQVTVSKESFGEEGSSIYLKLGQVMSLNDMLYGLMLRSGNDAAMAIAEHVGGSEEGFVYLMNEKAQWIGMDHSHFANPSGLDRGEHYSSANDMAKLAAYALKNPTFREIVKTKVKKVPDPDGDWDYVWYNKNKMLSNYDGADGVKTGYTKLSGRCLVSSATRNGRQLAVVTLNDPNDWADHAKLLNYGFQLFAQNALPQTNQSKITDMPQADVDKTDSIVNNANAAGMKGAAFQELLAAMLRGLFTYGF